MTSFIIAIRFGCSFSWLVKAGIRFLTILGPLILPSDLLFFLGGEVVCDIKCLSDLLGRLALDHVRNSLAADVEERLDIEVIGGLENKESVHQETNRYEGSGGHSTYKNNLKEHLLINLHKLLIPLFNIGSFLAVVRLVLVGGGRVVAMVLAPLDNLAQD